jgi:hypothetical protein
MEAPSKPCGRAPRDWHRRERVLSRTPTMHAALRSRLLILSLVLVSAARAPAQSPSPAAKPAQPEQDEPVTLSAFTISASSDVGYTATNTLAGTRINTPLRDVGAAVSVVTKEFLNDVNSHDSTTLLTYTVSTEIGGVEGNYAGGSVVLSLAPIRMPPAPNRSATSACAVSRRPSSPATSFCPTFRSTPTIPSG